MPTLTDDEYEQMLKQNEDMYRLINLQTEALKLANTTNEQLLNQLAETTDQLKEASKLLVLFAQRAGAMAIALRESHRIVYN